MSGETEQTPQEVAELRRLLGERVREKVLEDAVDAVVARLAQAEANLRALDSQIVEAETRASTSEAALLQLRRDHAELGCPDCQLWLSSLARVEQP